MDIFSQHLVPVLKDSAERHNLRHIVSISDSLPSPYRDVLSDLVSENEWMVLDVRAEGEAPLTAAVLAQDLLRERDNVVYATYRIDDDDIVSWDYFDRLRNYLQEPFVGMVVSFGQGITARYSCGSYFNVRACYQPMLAIGLANICMKRDGVVIGPRTRHTHNESHRSNPVILDSRNPSYIWTRHAEQDTNILWSKGAEVDVDRRLHEMLMKYEEPQALEELEKSFPTLTEKLRVVGREEPGSQRVPSRLLNDDGALCPLSPVEGRLRITLQVSAAPDSRPKNSLLSFAFEGDSGSPVRLEEVELSGTGLARSHREEVGVFCYLDSTPGVRTVEMRLRVPDGVRLVGVRLVHQRPGRPPLRVNDFTLVPEEVRI